ncbi:MAG: N-acetyltransferase [Elusimicrobia bacterium]|nr:N-acetyltransferase [Elusimicrobiota bacterium]
MIRLAVKSDARALAAIYRPIVEKTAVSFAAKPPTPAEMAKQVAELTPRLPWLVFEEDGAVLGYAYAGPHRAREAYRWCVETSVYVAPKAQGKGVGRALYQALLNTLRAQGYVNAYAGIVLPNKASIALHEAVGFRRFCVYEGIGYKLGKWHDVGWWRLRLRKTRRPTEPVPLKKLLAR